MKKDKTENRPSYIATKYTLSFAVRFCAVALIGFSLFGAVLFVLLNKRLGVGYFDDIAILSRLQERLPFVLWFTGMVQAAVVSLILLVLSLYWTHAVAGPLVRFRRYLSLMGKSESLGEIGFRETDQLHYLAQRFNRAQDYFKERNDKFASQLSRADQLIKEYEILLGQKGSEQLLLKEKRAALIRIYKDMEDLLTRGAIS